VPKKRERFEIFTSFSTGIGTPRAKELGGFSTLARAREFAREVAKATQGHVYVFDNQTSLIPTSYDFRRDRDDCTPYNLDTVWRNR
jgi:hypothetical protein